MSKNTNQVFDLSTISDSQLKNSILRLLEITSNNSQDSTLINPDLLRMRDEWAKMTDYVERSSREENVSLKSHFLTILNRDMDFISEAFANENLRHNGHFAEYIKRFADDYFVKCCQIMTSFFECVCQLSTKSREEQKSYFLEFPPILDDLNCLDGTTERINQLYLKLITEKKYQPLLDVHETVMRRYVDDLKSYVSEGNQIHILDYLSKELGFSQKAIPLYAESSIPPSELWRIYCNYASDLRDVLTGQDVLRGLAKKFPDTDLSKFDQNNSELIKAINDGLSKFEGFVERGFIDLSDFDYENNERPTAGLNTNLLHEAAMKSPAVLVLQELVDVHLNLEENELVKKLKDPSKISPQTTIFSNDFVRNLVAVLENDINDPFGRKILEIASNRNLKGGAVYQILDFHFRKELSGALGLGDKLAQLDKELDDLERHFGIRSDVLSSIFCNLSTEKIIKDISSASSLAEDISNRAGQQGIIASVDKLICRPDAQQIFDAIKNKLDGQKSPFMNVAFAHAAYLNKVDLCRSINDNFDIQPEVLTSGYLRLIHYTARRGWDSMVQFLAGFAVKKEVAEEFSKIYPPEYPITPAQQAAKMGMLSVIESMYRGGINHEIISAIPQEQGPSPLVIGAREGNTNIVKFFFESKLCLRPNRNEIARSIIGAIHCRQNHILKYFFDEVGIDPDLFNRSIAEGEYSPIQLAVAKDYVDIAKNLINHGVAANQIDQSGEGLLHLASLYDSSEMIKFLCQDCQLDPNLQNHSGNTPLHKAVNQQSINAIWALGNFGASPMIQNNDDKTPFDLAAEIKSNEVAVELLAIGDFLHNAANNFSDHHRLVLGKFIEAGIDLENFNPKNTSRETPLFLAAKSRNSEFISTIRSLGVNANSEDENGLTTIYYLAKEGLLDEIDFLLSEGANISHLNRDGKSVFQVLIEERTEKSVRALGSIYTKYKKHLSSELNRDIMDAAVNNGLNVERKIVPSTRPLTSGEQSQLNPGNSSGKQT